MYGEASIIDDSPRPFEGVSIVIPAHNEEQYLGDTLDAINRAIEDLKIVAEVIVVNDDSTDRTAEIARDRLATVVDVSLRNIGAVRNAGAQQARYPWLIFIDADTSVPTKTLAGTLANLADGDAGGGAKVDLPDRAQLFFLKRWMFYLVLLIWQIVGKWAAGCYMYCQKEMFDDFGGFDEDYYAAEEYFFSCQLKARGPFRLVQHPVMTSSRKLHSYSVWELARFLLVPMLSMGNMFKSKRGLELLYEDRR